MDYDRATYGADAASGDLVATTPGVPTMKSSCGHHHLLGSSSEAPGREVIATARVARRVLGSVSIFPHANLE